MEIYQMLQQSGWSKDIIDNAFSRAALFKNIDIILSSPILYFKNSSKFLILRISSAPSKTVKFVSKITVLESHKIADLSKKSFRKISEFLKFAFIVMPQNAIIYFQKNKKRKIYDHNAILELSKYIEKNLQEEAPENDIFIELLKTGWNKEIIDKAFSRVHSKIFRETSASFLKSLISLPYIITKKILVSGYSIIGNVFINLPLAMFNIGKKISIFASAKSRYLLSAIIPAIKNKLVSAFSKKPAPKIIFGTHPIKKTPITQKTKFIIFNLNNLLKSIVADFVFLFKRRVPIIKKKEIMAIKIAKPSPIAHLFDNIKYLITSYDTALPRLKQKLIRELSQSFAGLSEKLLRMFFSAKDFIKYDLRFLTRKAFIIWPSLLAKNSYNFLASDRISGLIKSAPKLLLEIVLSPFILVYKTIISFAKLIKKIDIKIFNIPFESAEFLISKIYREFKKATLPLILPLADKLKLSAKSLQKIMSPVSKEVSFLPQNLSEVPVGEVSDAMRAIDVLAIASRMFKTRRMRTFLTILGIGIGIGAILFLVSLGYGLQRILIEEIATSDALLSLDITTRDEQLIPLNKESIKNLASLPDVSYISPLISVAGQISLENITANTIVNGILPNYFKLAGISANAGELFQEGEEDKILISLPMVKLLGFAQDGQELSKEQLDKIIEKSVSVVLLIPVQTESGLEEVQTVDFKTDFKISGVVEDSAESLIYFPLSRLENVGITKYQSAKIRVKDNNSLEPIRSKAVEMGFIVAALSDTIEQANRVFQILQIVLALFGIVALAVSAIGMFNTMTIALLERTQEIGIMKSLGASNQNVWELFLAESIIMGFLGGVGGILVGYISSEGFNLLVRILAGALGGKHVQLFERPWWFILTILIFSTIVGLFTGLWPARRAARIKILEALRYK